MAAGIFERDSIRVIPVLGIFYLLLKAYVVSDYSLTTAGALVVAAPLSVLVGTVTSYLNLTLLVAACGTAWWLHRHRRSPHSHPADGQNLDAIAFGVLALSIAFLPWPFGVTYFREALLSAILYLLAVATAGFVVWFVTSRAQRWRRLGWLISATPRRIAAIAVVVLLIPTLDKPWVPAEVLVLRSDIAIQDSHLEDGELQRSRYPVVYVLSESARWTTVLDAESRILLRLPTDSIVHRQLCRFKDQPPGSVPVWAFIAGFRYDSPNTMCHTLVREHETLLDPLIDPELPDR